MTYVSEKIASVTAIVTAACLLALSTVSADAATTSKRTCQLNLATAKMKVLAISGTTATTNGLAFVDLLDTAVPIVKSATGCVVVQFSGDVQSVLGRAVLVRAVIATPLTLSVPQQATFVSRDETGLDEVSNAATFAFAALPAGAQTVKIQWKSTSNGLFVFFGNRTLTVYYQ